MSRKRKRRRENFMVITSTSFTVYKKADSGGPPYRQALEMALRKLGLMGVMFEAVILHADDCRYLAGARYCSCQCTLGELWALGEFPDPECNAVNIVHVGRNRN